MTHWTIILHRSGSYHRLFRGLRLEESAARALAALWNAERDTSPHTYHAIPATNYCS